jgi:hypothetical protein
MMNKIFMCIGLVVGGVQPLLRPDVEASTET